MSPPMREKMDIESLWLCGPEHDPKTQQIEDEDSYSAYQFDLDGADYILDDEESFKLENSNDLNNLHTIPSLNEQEEKLSDISWSNHSKRREIQDLSTESVYQHFIESMDDRLP